MYSLLFATSFHIQIAISSNIIHYYSDLSSPNFDFHVSGTNNSFQFIMKLARQCVSFINCSMFVKQIVHLHKNFTAVAFQFYLEKEI